MKIPVKVTPAEFSFQADPHEYVYMTDKEIKEQIRVEALEAACNRVKAKIDAHYIKNLIKAVRKIDGADKIPKGETWPGQQGPSWNEKW